MNPNNNFGINPQLTSQITQGMNPGIVSQLPQGVAKNMISNPNLQADNMMRMGTINNNSNNMTPIFLGYNANNLNTTQLTTLFTNLAKSYNEVCSGKDRMDIEENNRYILKNYC